MKSRGFLTPIAENYLHAYGVGYAAYRLAEQYRVNPQKAFIAGTLHDLGGAVPDSDRVAVAESLGISLNTAEYQVPMLVHAKLGDYFAQVLFGITDSDILNAIRYHTTGIDHATPLVKIVFLADKIQWDRNGEPPYLKGLLQALTISLDEGCRYFLKWLWQSDLYVVHPYLKRSYGSFIEQKNFQPLVRPEREVHLNATIKQNYYLDLVANEFKRAFKLGDIAYQLAQSVTSINADQAYVTAALTNMTHTIADDERLKIAQVLKIAPVAPIEPKLNAYFAQYEYGITDEDVLRAIRLCQQYSNDENTLSRVVAKSWTANNG